MILLVDLPGDGASAADLVVGDLTHALAGTLDIDGTPHRMSVSIGVSLFPRDATTGGDLIAAADAAMYRKKAQRRTTDTPPALP